MRRVDRRRWRLTRPPAGDRLLVWFRLPLLVVVGVALYGVVGCRVVAGWSVLDALYGEVRTGRFSTIIGCRFDPGSRQVTSSERVTPLYRTDSRA